MLFYYIPLLIVVIVGLLIGYILKRRTYQVYKGPSSSSVKRKMYTDKIGNYQLEPEIYVCPSTIDPTDYSHSDDSNDSD